MKRTMLNEFNAFFAQPVKMNDLSGFAVAACGMREELLAAIAELEAKLEHALSWEGLLEFVDEVYPSDTFTGESGDPGPRFIVLLRELKKAEAELADYKSRPSQARAMEAEEKLAWAEAELAEFHDSGMVTLAAFDAKQKELDKATAMLRVACVELTEYERSDLEQSSSDGIPPMTPDEWCAALRERAKRGES